MTNKFTLKDLKNGDVCELRMGMVVIAIPEIKAFVFESFDADTSLYYDENLNNIDVRQGLDKCYDIIRIYRPNAPYQCSFRSNDFVDGDVVFERGSNPEQDTIKVTMEQVCKIIGRNVEIV